MAYLNKFLDALVLPFIEGSEVEEDAAYELSLADERWMDNEAIFNSRKGYLN